jgi:hypothetical protein
LLFELLGVVSAWCQDPTQQSVLAQQHLDTLQVQPFVSNSRQQQQQQQ